LQKKHLVIAIYDPEWFIRVRELLKKRGVLFSYLYSPLEVPFSSVFYTDHKEFVDSISERRDLEVIYDPEHDCRGIEQAVMATYLIESFRELVVGVDPGKYIAYVALGDGTLVDYGKTDILGFVEELKYFLKCIPSQSFRVKIGASPKGLELVQVLRKEFKLPFEIVPEEKTSPAIESRDEIRYIAEKMRRGLRPFRFKDVYAAYRIALKKGVEVL